jgi:hypothetical protein
MRREMAGKLRFFLYRDDPMVSQFLEQLEGGSYDAESIRRQAGREGSVDAGVHAGPVSLGGSRKRSAGEESELSLRQTGASRFSRFHQLATDSGDIQPLDAIDEDIWDQVQTGEVIDAPVMVEVPEFLKSLSLATQASALLPFLEILGSVQGDEGKPVIDPSEIDTVKRQLPAVEQAAAMTEHAPVPVVATLATNPNFKFFMRLNRERIQVEDLQDLEGEARLVASIQSKVLRGKPTQVGELLRGLPSQNRAQRRRSGSTNSGTVTLRYPSAVVAAIALFR